VTTTLISEGTTKVDISLPQIFSKTAADGSIKTIETSGYIVSQIPALGGVTANRFGQVVLDETDDAQVDPPSRDDFELTLDVFHLLRRCPQHPDEIPRPSEVALPLAPLRRYLVEALVRHREEKWPRKRKAEEEEVDPAMKVEAEEVDSATTRCMTPPMLREWKQRKKNKRAA
jgi:hypothetical protein